jgi:AcrR family transcriptional regulator
LHEGLRGHLRRRDRREGWLQLATFFNHFGSKAAVLRFYGQDLEQKVQPSATGADGGPPLVRLRRVLDTMAAEAESQRENLKVIFAHSVRDPDYFTRPTEARESLLKQMAGLIAEAVKRGEVRGDVPPRELALALMALHDSATVSILFAGVSAVRAVERVWAFAMGGLVGTGVDGRSAARRRK